ncbi:MAG: DUF2202 domain-containing protein [Phycisphaerales bacterium]
MKSTLMTIVSVPLVLAACASHKPAPTATMTETRGCCMVAMPAGESSAVSPAIADALRAALEDERRSEAFYTAVMEVHGQVRPFSNIVRAERQHQSVVVALMERHGVPVPQAGALDIPDVASTLRECKRAAAQAERDNIALYDTLIPTIKEPDIRQAFLGLQAASRDHHLPAFERGL